MSRMRAGADLTEHSRCSIPSVRLAGLLADQSDKRFVLMGFMAINFIAVWGIMYRRHNAVKMVYNRAV